MTTPDFLDIATQKIVADITARYNDASTNNHIPDNWELVGLAVQLIENPIEGVAKLTGTQKMEAVKKIIATVIQQLPIPESSKQHLQQTYFKIEDLVEVSLSLLKSNAKLEKSCFACLGCTSKLLRTPFEVVKK